MDLEPLAPGWWLNRLVARMSEQVGIVTPNERWYNGEHPLPSASTTHNELYRNFQRMSQTNLVGRVVDVAASRLAITGVRTGDEDMDQHLWDLWQRSQMDSEQETLFVTALATGIAYISVWPDPETGVPTFYPEHPAQVVHIPVPGRPRQVAAALKVFYDELEMLWVAVLYLPDRIYKWVSAAAIDGISNFAGIDAEEIPNPFGVIPIVPLRNRPTLTGWYQSEMKDAIPIQKRINQTLLNMMVAQEAVAFPQRYAVGMEMDKDDNGQPLRPFRSSPDALWVAEDPDVKFGQFAESRFDGYLAALRQDTEALASVTNTPAFNLSAHMMVPPSAEALSAMESSLINKIKAKQLIFGEAVEHAMRYAMMMEGHDPEELQTMEVIWRDPRVRADGAVGDFAVKLQAVGVPQEAIWAELGATPQMIEEWKTMQMRDEFKRLIAQVATAQQDGTFGPDQAAQEMADGPDVEGSIVEQPTIPGEVEDNVAGVAEMLEQLDEDDDEEEKKPAKKRARKAASLPQGTTDPYPGFDTGGTYLNGSVR